MSSNFSRGALLFVVVAGGCGGSDTSPMTQQTVAASIDLAMSDASPITAIGDTRTLSIIVRDANGAVIAAAPVSLVSSNTAIATVAGSGASATVVATGNGTATITATSGSVTKQLQVSVAQRLSTIALAATPMVMGNTLQLQPVARDSRNVAITGVTGYAITSATPSVVAVNPSGLATAIAPGSAALTASLTRDGITATVNTTVTVSSPISANPNATVTATTQSTFDPATVSITPGGTVTWVFQSIEHNVAFQSAGAPASIGNSTNTSIARTFAAAGSYPYVCTIHSGMNGTVNVALAGFFASLNGANERPAPNTSPATGAAAFSRNGATITYVITYQGLSGIATGAHLHGPAGSDATADILVSFNVASQTGTTGVITGTFTAAAIQGVNGNPPMTLDQLMALITAGSTYVNVHTTQFPAGEIRGQVGSDG